MPVKASTTPIVIKDLNNAGAIPLREDRLKQTIAKLRLQLSTLAKEKGLSDLSVLALSQELDLYIVEFQRRYAGARKCSTLTNSWR